jgi:hypothetical protein
VIFGFGQDAVFGQEIDLRLFLVNVLRIKVFDAVE